MKKILSVSLCAVALALMSGLASAGIMFVSDTGDGCKVVTSSGQQNCTGVTDGQVNSWISEAAFNAAAGSTGAEWIQAAGSFNQSNLNDYRIFELDLNRNGPWEITDLWLSADDSVVIRVGGVEIWDSKDNFMSNPWTQAIDVIADLGSSISVGANQRINFYVHDIGNSQQGPTGLIYAGQTAMVPEPSIIALFAAGLLGLGFVSRRKRG